MAAAPPDALHDLLMQLVEVVLDLGRRPLARFPDIEVALSEGIVTRDDLDHAVSQVSAFDEDNRAGMERTLHRVSTHFAAVRAFEALVAN